MKYKKINIGIVGLGQIGSRLYKEILSKKKEISSSVKKFSIKIHWISLSTKILILYLSLLAIQMEFLRKLLNSH